MSVVVSSVGDCEVGLVDVGLVVEGIPGAEGDWVM